MIVVEMMEVAVVGAAGMEVVVMMVVVPIVVEVVEAEGEAEIILEVEVTGVIDMEERETKGGKTVMAVSGVV